MSEKICHVIFFWINKMLGYILGIFLSIQSFVNKVCQVDYVHLEADLGHI